MATAPTEEESNITGAVATHWKEQEREELILNIHDLERAAERKLPKVAREYYNSGATGMVTYRANTSAFDKYFLRSRVLVDVSKADSSIDLFGTRIPFPCCVAPTSFHKLAHADGEVATARGAGAVGVAMGLSSYASTLWEDVVPAGRQVGGDEMMFVAQLYISPNREVMKKLVGKAEDLGCKAIFLTADAPILGTRWNETRNGFVRYAIERFDIPNLMQAVDPDLEIEDAAKLFQDASHNWDRDIPFLRSITKMKIFIKGVLTAEDTEKAIEHGADGIIVSNHGGRQLDCVPATLDVLSECLEVAKGRIPVHIDGGFRSGSDIFKAIALGAQCVWVGRPVLWGLAVDGSTGVELALRMLNDEFFKTMQLMGCNSVADIDKSRLAILNSRGLMERV